MGGKEGSYCGKPSNKQIEPGITISKTQAFLLVGNVLFFLRMLEGTRKPGKTTKAQQFLLLHIYPTELILTSHVIQIIVCPASQ